MQENRLAKVESQLTGKQRGLTWLHQAQQLGGWREGAERTIKTEGTCGWPRLTIDYMDSCFIHECVCLCNACVLELLVPGAEKRLLALFIRRLFHRRDSAR